MSNVDLGRLVGGKSCFIPCTIFRNGYQVFCSALADTEANAFALLNTECANKISTFLTTPLEPLPHPVRIHGYDKQGGQLVTSVLRAHICIDGRRQYNVPFLIADLGGQVMILGQKWYTYFVLRVVIRNRRSMFPHALLRFP